MEPNPTDTVWGNTTRGKRHKEKEKKTERWKRTRADRYVFDLPVWATKLTPNDLVPYTVAIVVVCFERSPVVATAIVERDGTGVVPPVHALFLHLRVRA